MPFTVVVVVVVVIVVVVVVVVVTVCHFYVDRGQPASSARHSGEHPADETSQRPNSTTSGQPFPLYFRSTSALLPV